jgi:hypothetical protein
MEGVPASGTGIGQVELAVDQRVSVLSDVGEEHPAPTVADLVDIAVCGAQRLGHHAEG